MKLRYILMISLFGMLSPLFAQKPALELDKIGNDKWPRVGGPTISNDGQYVSYTINNWPLGSNTTVVKATKGSWKTEVPGISNTSFTRNNRKLVYMKGDSLCLLTLGGIAIEKIFPVSYFRMFNQGKQEMLCIQKSNTNSELLLCNLASGKMQSYPGVLLFTISDNGNVILLQKTVKSEMGMVQLVEWLDLPSGKTNTVWQGAGSPGYFTFDATAGQMAFTLTEMVNRKEETSFWYYKPGMAQAELLVNKATPGIDPGVKLENTENFSKDGTRVFIKLKEQDFPKAKPDAVKVDVWSYIDAKLQSQQLKNLEDSPLTYLVKGIGIGPQSYTAIIDLTTYRITRLQQEGETLDLQDNEKGDRVALSHVAGDGSESHWSTAAQVTYSLVSAQNGERKSIPMKLTGRSPDDRYGIGSDCEKLDIYSYEISSGITRNLTEFLPVPLGDAGEDNPSTIRSRGLSVAAWLPKDEGVLIYDKYDIWQLDPLGKKAPLNLTNGYGRKNHISFRIIGNHQTIALNQTILLSAFNTDNKNSGFYRMILGKKGNPGLLTMGPYLYFNADKGFGKAPVKARDAEMYVVERQDARKSPNLFLSRDLKSFTPLTDVYPEKNYNWMTSELINFKTLDGKPAQGALYKPENFDPSKKYPLIIQYYERKSDYLNTYHQPETSMDNINIPWFVSRGYLVFTPDIHYKIGEPGESALNTVVSAATHLKALTYVDGKKMGIQGHSFGGFQTNYIITHSNLFAAALSAAGPSDMISFYNDLWGGGNSKQSSLEIGQLRIGTIPWERPDLYIKNSPVLQADKVSTPLLMMHNKEDGAVSFFQGVEFFTALRRLGKRAWMLQYDKEGHSLINKKNREDYTIRMTQFFDHYLKGVSAPLWMLKGISAKMKGVDDGLALDTSGAIPGPGLLMQEKKAGN